MLIMNHFIHEIDSRTLACWLAGESRRQALPANIFHYLVHVVQLACLLQFVCCVLLLASLRPSTRRTDFVRPLPLPLQSPLSLCVCVCV